MRSTKTTLQSRPKRAPILSFRLIFLAVLVAFAPSFLVGCIPATDARYKDFLDKTNRYRIVGDPGASVVGGQYNFSGRYVFALQTTLSDYPFLFLMDVTAAPSGESFSFTYQALNKAFDTRPFQPVGQTYHVDNVQVSQDGKFQVSLGEVTFPGSANPASGGNVVATVDLSGTVTSDSSFCGIAEGKVTKPVPIELKGATFAITKMARNQKIKEMTLAVRCTESDQPDDSQDTDNAYERCPSLDLFGGWEFEFKPTFATQRTNYRINLNRIAADDEVDRNHPKCYEGELSDPQNPSNILGKVDRLVEKNGRLVMSLAAGSVSPGLVDELPDGASFDLTATATAYNNAGLCGDYVGNMTTTDASDYPQQGTWSMSRFATPQIMRSTDPLVSGCAAVPTTASCAEFDTIVPGSGITYEILSAEGTNAPASYVANLSRNPLSCVSGTLLDSSFSGNVVGHITATDVTQKSLILTGFHPFGSDSWGERRLAISNVQPGVSFCGLTTTEIYAPSPNTSTGTFSASTSTPSAPKCSP